MELSGREQLSSMWEALGSIQALQKKKKKKSKRKKTTQMTNIKGVAKWITIYLQWTIIK